jgi:hypothetical protein
MLLQPVRGTLYHGLLMNLFPEQVVSAVDPL